MTKKHKGDSRVLKLRKILREYNEFNNKMIYSGELTDFEIDCFIKYNQKDSSFEFPEYFLKETEIKGDKGKYWYEKYIYLLDNYNDLEKKHNKLCKNIKNFEDEFKSHYNSSELMLDPLKDILITKKSLMIALNLAYKFGRDNGAKRSELNFNDLAATSIVQELLSKTYQNE